MIQIIGFHNAYVPQHETFFVEILLIHKRCSQKLFNVESNIILAWYMKQKAHQVTKNLLEKFQMVKILSLF